MGFWTLFEVASMPILQVLIISSLGAFMATDYLNLLHTDARKSLNIVRTYFPKKILSTLLFTSSITVLTRTPIRLQIVFVVFTPSLMFASLAETVTFEDLVAW